jgi:SAM-dependent methyltransferase
MFVADRLAHTQPGVGLDVASGEGRNAIWLAERGWKMTAVDFSEVAIERGRATSDDVDFVVADVLEWEPEESFDLALIAYLHLGEGEMRQVIERVASWLKPGGELFLIGHDESNIAEGHGGPQVAEILTRVEATVEWLEDLEIVEAQVVRRPVDTDEGRVFARDALVRARVPT